MLTNLDARANVIAAIEAGDATRDDFDIDAIVQGVYAATGAYDTEAMEASEFWSLVEENELTGPKNLVTKTQNDSGAWEIVETEDAGDVTSANLADMIDISATDLGCQPGTEYRVELVRGETVLGFVEVQAS